MPQNRRLLLAFLVAATLTAVLAPGASADGTIVATLPKATQGREMITAPDGSIWFLGVYGQEEKGGGSFVGHLDASGQVREITLPHGRQPGAPVVGPEGEIWFPEGGGVKGHKGFGLASVSADGRLQLHPLGATRKGYLSEVAAAGGDLWVSGANLTRGGKRRIAEIARVALSPRPAVVQEYELRASCYPTALAARGTAIWFAEFCNHSTPRRVSSKGAIVRIGPAGLIARYPLPAMAFVESLAVAPGGTLWYGSYGNSGRRIEFGRITPDGDLAGYRVPRGRPSTIAVGPEGRLWFPVTQQQQVYSGLSSIDAAGQLGETVCVGPECGLEAEGLTFGLDGSLWFDATEAHAPYGGGGGGALIENLNREKEAGVLGKLTP